LRNEKFMNNLNVAQIQILKLFQAIKNEKDLLELKTLLIQYLAKKTVEEADKAFDEKGYSQEMLQNWQYEHFRSSQKL
jgi:hypothetical protein